MQQLEDVVGVALFRRHGRGVTLTPAGERLLPVARQVTQSLSRALAELRGEALNGKLRVGIADDHSRSMLAHVVADFATCHPDVELEVHCASGSGFGEALRTGALDVAVHEVPEPADDDHVLRKDHLIWMCSAKRSIAMADVLPIAVFDRDCWWRDIALADLACASRRYRVVFSSESAIGVRAAVHSGIAAGLLCKAHDVRDLVPLPEMPARHNSYLVLQKARDAKGPAVDAMCEALRNAFRD